jgi:hypothetical protein
MVLQSPWFLLSILPVLAVAAWTLRRPAGRDVTVPYLALWAEALHAATSTGRRRRPRITASWLLLLAGTLLTALALSGPVVRTAPPRRWIRVAPCPSADIDVDHLRESVDVLLDRLGPADRVQLALPALLGGQYPWQAPGEVRNTMPTLSSLPARAEELTFPPMDEETFTVLFVPAGYDFPAGPSRPVVDVETRPPSLNWQAITAQPTGNPAAPGESSWSLFARFTSPARDESRLVATLTAPIRSVRLQQQPIPSTSDRTDRSRVVNLPFPPDEPALQLEVTDGESHGRAWLVRREARPIRVAIQGSRSDLLDRAVKADPQLQRAAADRADVILAAGHDVSGDAPAVLFDPPNAPPTWRTGRTMRNVRFHRAALAADPVMRDVNPAALAVRTLTPWVGSENASQRVLLALDGQAVVLRSQPSADPSGQTPRRVWIAFGFTAANTSADTADAPFVLLGNAIRWAANLTPQPMRYTWRRPVDAGPQPGWTRLAGESHFDGPLPGPGLYRDGQERLHAVNLTGLSETSPAIASAQQAALLKLPAPKADLNHVAIWPWILVAGLLCCSMSWVICHRSNP